MRVKHRFAECMFDCWLNVYAWVGYVKSDSGDSIEKFKRLKDKTCIHYNYKYWCRNSQLTGMLSLYKIQFWLVLACQCSCKCVVVTWEKSCWALVCLVTCCVCQLLPNVWINRSLDHVTSSKWKFLFLHGKSSEWQVHLEFNCADSWKHSMWLSCPIRFQKQLI